MSNENYTRYPLVAEAYKHLTMDAQKRLPALIQCVFTHVSTYIIKSFVFRCSCENSVRSAIATFQDILDTLYGIPERMERMEEDDDSSDSSTEYNSICDTVETVTSMLSNYVDEHMDLVSNCPRTRRLTPEETLETNMMTSLGTFLCLEHIWIHLVNLTDPVHPTKTNLEIIQSMRNGILLIGDFHDAVSTLAKEHPLHFLFIILNQYSPSQPLEIHELCTRALRFIIKNGETFVTHDDQMKMPEIIKQMILPIKNVAANKMYDSETYSSEESSDSN